MKFGIRLDVDVCLTHDELTKSKNEEIIELVSQVCDDYGFGGVHTFDAVESRYVLQPCTKLH